MGDKAWTMGLLLPGSENNKVNVAGSETRMEGWIFLNSRGKLGELPRITKKDFCKSRAIHFLLGVTKPWESLKQGLTGPETALDGCFIHQPSA